jgi:uncharacterized protein YjbI with pentapeptide repeats
VITAQLLDRLLEATRGESGGAGAEVGSADFAGATFTEGINFSGVTFRGAVNFSCATFIEYANFACVTFGEGAKFRGATFESDAEFEVATFIKSPDFTGASFARANFTEVTFTEHANFMGASFAGGVRFVDSTFIGDADFRRATFTGAPGVGADFRRATFTETVDFTGATFTKEAHFEGARIRGRCVMRGAARGLIFSEAKVEGELMVEVASRRVILTGVRASSRVVLRLRAARVDLSDAVFTGPASVHGLQHPVAETDESLFVDAETGRVPGVAVVSLAGTDAERLVLTDVDLSTCRLAGMHRLDQLSLDGQCLFATDPRSGRRVLAEEHYWRASRGGRGAARWSAPPEDAEVVGPARLEMLYRQLRKALEEGKNEPGAADFYYGEMEMRRARTSRFLERWLLHLYWASSGYALRARRAAATLLLMVAAMVAALTLVGFPEAPATPQRATGTAVGPDGKPQAITLTLPANSPPASPLRGWSDRLDKATTATLGAVFVRPPATGLTLAGRYIELVARVLGPLLLAMTLLTVRNRVKR